MKVSVLIPTRDRAGLLEQALTSLDRQTMQPGEIIVIDDGSQDGTSEMLSRLGSTVRAFRQPASSGKSAALNRGMAEATGDAIIVLDDDDLFPPRAIERHVRALADHPDADFSYGRLMRFSGEPPDPAEIAGSHPDIDPVPASDGRRTIIKLMEECFLPNPAWMARRSALERAGPYDTKLARSQDYDMILRLAQRNDGAFVDDIVLLQRRHGEVRPGVVAATGGNDSRQAWLQYDRLIFQRLAREWPIDSYRPFLAAGGEDPERAAWLQKGVLMFLKGCLPESAEAFARHQELIAGGSASAGELAVAARLFHVLFRVTPLQSLPGKLERAEVAQVMKSGGWRNDLKLAFVQGGRWHVRAALGAGDYAAAAAYAKFMASLLGASLVAKSFASKLGVGSRDISGRSQR